MSILMRSKIRHLTQEMNWILWIFLLISVPVTSFPMLSRLMGWATVSPLAGLPALLLVFSFLIPYMIQDGRMPRVMLPLAVFVLIVLIGSFRAPFLDIPRFKVHSILGRETRAFFTLGVGCIFYLLAALLPRDENQLERSLRWIHIGGVIMLAWATVQILRFPYSYNPQPPRLNAFHRLFSIRDMFRDRITGFAYEPSWLADQLVILYLPIWLASVVRGATVFRWRWGLLTIELGLLVWGAVVFFFTYSRIGWVAWALVALVLLGVGGWRVARRVSNRLRGQGKSTFGLTLLLWLLSLIVALAFAIFLTRLAALSNQRIHDILDFELSILLAKDRFPVIFNMAQQFEMAERLLYWISAFLVFCQYPILGVGLGNAGFFFRTFVPGFATQLPETIRLLSHKGYLFPNPKNLWLRLLAETGIVGFLAFMLWLIVMGFLALNVSKRKGKVMGVIGLAAGMSLIAQIMEGWSLDTFALPQLWLMLGLLTAASMMPIRVEGEHA